MNILALDTTSQQASISILKDDEIQLEYNFTSRDNLSALLAPSLQFLVKSAGLSFPEIDLYAVGIGPGQFTGIRVGLSLVKGMLIEQPKPVVPVVTLHALAYKVKEYKKIIIPLIDARRKEVYYACYKNEGGEISELIPPALAKVEEIADIAAPFPEKIFVGSGAEKNREWIKKQFLNPSLLYRSHYLASEIGRIAWQEYQKQRFLTNPGDLTPLYIRRPDAETGSASR